MREDEFQEELRPGPGSEFGRKIRQRPATRRTEQGVAPERQVDEHRRTCVARSRQQHALRLAVAERVVHLEEIGLFAHQHFADRLVLAQRARGHADVAA
ncbi:hypothetical protein D3C83_33260 [compost metagenome]